MEWLNYHHLLYFWVVAREGGLAPAGRVLRLAHPTLSSQIHALEEALGEKLFAREGRRLALTETGRIVYRYAEEIFSLGRELVDAVKDRPTGKPLRVVVGVADVLSKFVVRRLLAPALQLPEPVRLVCREDRHERLLAELAIHGLDLVLADAPVPPGSRIRAVTHLLGECGVTFFGCPPLAERLRAGFPQSLDGAPMLLPLETLPIRRALDYWFESVGVRPRIVGEFEDSALLKVFGSEGLGVFAAPGIVEGAICRKYEVNVLGRTHEVCERFYAISVERRIQNPAAVAICNAARQLLGDSERRKGTCEIQQLCFTARSVGWRHATTSETGRSRQSAPRDRPRDRTANASAVLGQKGVSERELRSGLKRPEAVATRCAFTQLAVLECGYSAAALHPGRARRHASLREWGQSRAGTRCWEGGKETLGKSGCSTATVGTLFRS